MNEKKINLPAIIIAVAAIVVIGGLLVLGIVSLNNKNEELVGTQKELAAKQNDLAKESEELSKTLGELSETKDALKEALAELDKNIEEKTKVTAERDKLIEEDEARKKAEADTTASDEAEKEAIGKMLAIFNEVSDLQSELSNAAFKKDDNEYAEINDAFETYSNKFDRCAAEFMVLKDVPANFYNAGKEWMEINMVCIDETRELIDFMYNFYYSMGQLSGYIDLMKDFEVSEAWFDNAQECISEMVSYITETECPAYLTPLWERWGNAVRMNNEFTDRMGEGIYSSDYLKLNSAYNLINRIFTIMTNLGDEISNAVSDGLEFSMGQIEKANLIFDEINESKELPYGERSSYVFKNKFEGEVNLTFKAIDKIYPSLYNSYDHFVTIQAGCISGEKDIVVECEIPGLTQKYEQKFRLSSNLLPIYIKPPAATQVKNLDSAWDSMIKITIKDESGNYIDAKSFPIHIYSANDFKWIDDEFGVCTQDNILCFISPDSEAITELKRKAIDILDELTEGDMSSFAGYQGPVYSELIDTFLYSSALMIAMSDMGVRYSMDPFSIDGADQHILFPKQVLEQKSGLCIETSLVIASALQSAGMHTYLVFPEGHAQVAVETWDHSGEYLLIETTEIPCSWEGFEDYLLCLLEGRYDNEILCPVLYLSGEEWNYYINVADVYLVDCGDGKLLGLTPFAY